MPRAYCPNSYTVPKKASDLAAEDDIREAFRVFDRDGNGHISRDEMKAVMMNIGKLGFESEIRVGHKINGMLILIKKKNSDTGQLKAFR